jgi:hypothetical protein
MMSQANSKSVLLYAFVGTTPCEDVVAANLDGLQIGFTTNQVDQNYTLSFIDYEGRTLKLYDLVENTEIVIAAGETYPFSVDASLVGQHEVNGRFVINYQAAPQYAAEVTTNAYGLATFSNDENLVPVEADVKLYKGIFSSLDDNLGLQSVSAVDHGEGVIVYGTPNTTYHFEATADECGEFDGNDLKASSMWESRGNGYIYVLSGDALYLYEGTAFPANKAFLEVPASNGAPRRIGFAFDNATAIDNVEVEAVKAEKFIEDGQLFIRRGNEVFNLQGQIVK